MSFFNTLLASCDPSKKTQIALLLPVFIISGFAIYRQINKNKIEIAIYLYQKYKVIKEFFSRKHFIDFFQFVDEHEVFHIAGYLNGKPIKIEPYQLAIDREVKVKINGTTVPSLTGVLFDNSKKYDSSTTFLFIYPHIVAHEDDFEVEVECLVTESSSSKKYLKGSHIDLKKEIEAILD